MSTGASYFNVGNKEVLVSVDRAALVSHLNTLLCVSDIPDDSCNGLQVEGCEEITTVGLAVDACLGVFEKAAAAGCQMLLVHHGIIWKGITAITGSVRRRIEFLLTRGLNLYAAHLPLDLHPELGNNICLARSLGLVDRKPFGMYKGRPIGFMGALAQPMGIDAIGLKLRDAIGGSCSSLPFGKELNRTVGIVSGGGADIVSEAVAKGLDCYVTGEPTHWNHHVALEGRLNVLYCGHYHTETLGVKLLGEHLSETFGLKTLFIDEPTLV
jgi:dinuclear metal center YbgI/SA1388 family protein